MTWILTKGLQNLRRQIDDWAPDRDHTSDGTIGDAVHQAEVSGHNPDDTAGSKAEWNGDPDNTPEVRAIDIDTDFRNGASAQNLVDHIVGLKPSSVLRYIIYNRLIYKSTNKWLPETYYGASAHTEHIHFSGAYTQESDNDTTFDYRLEDIPVALTQADKDWILGLFQNTNTSAAPESVAGKAAGIQQFPDHTQKNKPQVPYYVAFNNLVDEVMDIKGAVAAIENGVDELIEKAG